VRNKTGKLLSVMWIPVLLMILAVCIGCQQQAPVEEAKAPVVIESKTPEPSPTPTAEAPEPEAVISANFTPKSTKDPFVPVVRRQGEETAAPPPVTPDTTGEPGPPSATAEGPSGEGADIGPTAEETPRGPQIITEKEAGVSVTGIMRIGGRYSAILSSEKRSYIVKSGQKLGDWVVSGISAKSVTLSGKGYKAILKLPDEMKALKGKSGTGVTGTAPGQEPEEDKGPKLPSGSPEGGGGEVAPPPPPPPGE